MAIGAEITKVFSNPDCFLDPNVKPPPECMPDYSALPKVCEDAGLDYFTYDSTTACVGGSSMTVTGKPFCFPSSCTSDEAELKLIMAEFTSDNDEEVTPPICPGDGSDATCCDVDGSCTDGNDDWCCDGGTFYCSNNGQNYDVVMGRILFPYVPYDIGSDLNCDTTSYGLGDISEGSFSALIIGSIFMLAGATALL